MQSVIKSYNNTIIIFAYLVWLKSTPGKCFSKSVVRVNIVDCSFSYFHFLLGTGGKLIVQKRFRKSPRRLINVIWDKVFKSELSKLCGRQPLKNLKGYGLLKSAADQGPYRSNFPNRFIFRKITPQTILFQKIPGHWFRRHVRVENDGAKPIIFQFHKIWSFYTLLEAQ